jgi:outer membrane protein OmpA-like peptidoglycan-associated protein
MTKKYYKDIIFSVVTLFVFCSAAFSQSGLVQAIYFKSNSFSIDKKYKKTLDLIAKQIYADKSGSENYNDILSEKRATAVYDYLSVRVKIDTTKVFVTWIGKSAEAYDLHFPAAHIQKRCVDIWVTFYRKPKN